MAETHARGSIMYVPRMDAAGATEWRAESGEPYGPFGSRLSALGSGLSGICFPIEVSSSSRRARGFVSWGLDPEDADWARIGWDWVRPSEKAAWERLNEKRALARFP
jgi:hypothetical protein